MSERRPIRTNHVLIDCENVQPKDFGLLEGGPIEAKLFLGPNQAKIPAGLAVSLQTPGANAEYVPLEVAGASALDFHIAYHIGVLSALVGRLDVSGDHKIVDRLAEFLDAGR